MLQCHQMLSVAFVHSVIFWSHQKTIHLSTNLELAPLFPSQNPRTMDQIMRKVPILERGRLCYQRWEFVKIHVWKKEGRWNLIYYSILHQHQSKKIEYLWTVQSIYFNTYDQKSSQRKKERKKTEMFICFFNCVENVGTNQ